MLKANKNQIHKAPTSPGIYQFKNASGEILYIGKAKNLKNRLISYFSTNLLPKTAQMVSEAKTISVIKVASEFEALLLEANLIRKYKPKYNIELKDDKSPLYIGITSDFYPRIITFRKTEANNIKLKAQFGPYLRGKVAKTILRRLRHIFPYSTHLPTNKICIYRQIGLCNPCPSEIINSNDLHLKTTLRKKYLSNIRHLKIILGGNISQVTNDLKKEMTSFVKKEYFEEADNIAKQLKMLEDLTVVPNFDIETYLENPNLEEDIRQEELQDLYLKLQNINLKSLPTTLNRIECFDVAHLAGTFPTASMVTFINAESDNKYYRHFKIYQKKNKSDVDSIEEVVKRRLTHLDDWGKPDLIILDGGKPQLTAVHKLLEDKNIAFIGLAKREETIVIRFPDGKFKEIKASGPSLKLLQRLRDEAHRFARRLHYKQIKNTINL